MQKGEQVKDNRAKRSNVEVTSIVGGRLLSAYVGCYRTPGTGSVTSSSWLCSIKLLAHAHSWHTHSEDEKKKNQSSKKEGRKNNNKREVRPNSPN